MSLTAQTNSNQTPPTEIRLGKDKTTLTVVFTQNTYTFTAEFLRVLSPSAEVQGHGPGQQKTIGGKKNVTITGLEPVGHYALKITFSDGHASGIYTWNYFAEMGEKQLDEWQAYTKRLAAAGLTREAA